MSIQVKPPEIAIETWLIADDLKIIEKELLQPEKLMVGAAIEREITISAVNTLSVFLPELSMTEQSVTEKAIPEKTIPEKTIAEKPWLDKPRPDKPSLTIQKRPIQHHDETDKEASIARKTQRWRIIFNHPGIYTFPGMSLKWWNRQKQRIEIVQLPQRKFEVLAKPKTRMTDEPKRETPQQITPKNTKKREQHESNLDFGLPIVWGTIFGIGGLLLLAYGYVKGWNALFYNQIKRRYQLKSQIKHAWHKDDPKRLKAIIQKGIEQEMIEPNPQLEQLIENINHCLYAKTDMGGKKAWRIENGLPMILKSVVSTRKPDQKVSSPALKPLG